MMKTKRIFIALSAVLLCMACTSPEPPLIPTEPGIVLDGTEIFEIAVFKLRPLDESSVGEYGAEQGGAVLSLQLSLASGIWTAERIHQEPGDSEDRAVYMVALQDGLLRSPDEGVLIRGTQEGVIVLERASTIISAEYWVHYLRHP